LHSISPFDNTPIDKILYIGHAETVKLAYLYAGYLFPFTVIVQGSLLDTQKAAYFIHVQKPVITIFYYFHYAFTPSNEL
jgi:hypothetical protein